jgi:hypothetical protein
LRCQQALNRFRRRGLQAVKREFALHVLAHNLSRAVALSRALFTLLYADLRGLHEGAHRFLNRFLDLLVCAKAITSTPGLQLDAQQKRFATASLGQRGRQAAASGEAAVAALTRSVDVQYKGFTLISVLASPVPAVGACENNI